MTVEQRNVSENNRIWENNIKAIEAKESVLNPCLRIGAKWADLIKNESICKLEALSLRKQANLNTVNESICKYKKIIP